MAARSVLADDRRPQDADCGRPAGSAGPVYQRARRPLQLDRRAAADLKAYVEKAASCLSKRATATAATAPRSIADFRALMPRVVPEQRAAQAAAGSCRLVRPRKGRSASSCRRIRSSGCGASMPAAGRASSIARGACRATGSWPIRIARAPCRTELKNQIEAGDAHRRQRAGLCDQSRAEGKARPAAVACQQSGRQSPRGALVVPKLSHGGGSDDAPAALNNLLLVMEQQLQMRVDYQKPRRSPRSTSKLLDYPLIFTHGRRAFRFTPPSGRP